MSTPGESWGRHPHQPPAQTIDLRDRHAPLPACQAPILTYGNGRSYGDSCQNGGGSLLLARSLDRFIAFDRERGVLRCEAGVLLDEILRLIVPHGWFLPVVPGTRLITLGGAIANDVHGKNHHQAGSFGRHVQRLELLRSDGERLLCSPQENAGLFEATVGGLGLTGLITWADIGLVKIPAPWMDTETIRFTSLDTFFELSTESESSHAYSAAWIDCMAPRQQLGRGLFSRANFVADERALPVHPGSRLRVPFTPPFALLGGLSTRLFNRIWFHRPQRRNRRIPHHRFLFPLDGVAEWNRLYGPRGFFQHQCVLPPASEREALTAIMSCITQAGTGSFLAVLKRFGPLASPGLISFPRPGTTLALDFPNRGDATLNLLDRLDAIVAEAGGAVYPAKDARMSGKHFRQFFSNWPAFSTHIDPKFSSNFWRRVMADIE